MGCGASLDKNSSSAVVDPGGLRDRSLPQTVILQEGVARAGARNPSEQQKQQQQQHAQESQQQQQLQQQQELQEQQQLLLASLLAASPRPTSVSPTASSVPAPPRPPAVSAPSDPPPPPAASSAAHATSARRPVSASALAPTSAGAASTPPRAVSARVSIPQTCGSNASSAPQPQPASGAALVATPPSPAAAAAAAPAASPPPAPELRIAAAQEDASTPLPEEAAGRAEDQQAQQPQQQEEEEEQDEQDAEQEKTAEQQQQPKLEEEEKEQEAQTLLVPQAALGASVPSSAAAVLLPPEEGQQEQQPQQQQPPPPPQPRMVDCAVSLRFLMDFCDSVPQDMPTWKVVTDVIVPATRERRCRYVEMIDPRDVGRCDYFISHRWATPFSHLVHYVRKHLIELGDVREAATAAATGSGAAPPPGSGADAAEAEEAAGAAGAEEEEGSSEAQLRADQVFVWCDIFAINQHPGQIQADDLSQLKDCVVASKQTLLCLDDQGMVLTRIWCLYEIWNTVLVGGAPKLAVLGYDVKQDAFKEVYITLDVGEAQATVESDRVRILADIAASTGLQELNLVIKRALIESTQAEAENAQKVLLPSAKDWKDFQRIIEAITKHTQMLTAVGRHQESARYGYLIQAVSDKWQKSQQQQQQQQRPTPSSAAGAEATVEGEAAAGAGAASDASAPAWHWSHYPRDPELRQVLERARAAERAARFDSAMTFYREVVSKAIEKQQQMPPQEATSGDAAEPPAGTTTEAAAALGLDLAGCRLHLGVFLASRGFVEQAACEEGEPAVQLFGQLAGRDSLSYASAAHQGALLCKHVSQSTELRSRLLAEAYDILEPRLGPSHAATLDTLREKAEMTYSSGDFPGGIALYHQLAVRLSVGADLLQLVPDTGAADPPGGVERGSEQVVWRQQQQQQTLVELTAGASAGAATGTIAATAASTTAVQLLSAKAVETWFLLASYLGNSAGREDDSIRLARALIPHKRRDYIRRLREAVGSGGEYASTAEAELLRLQLPRRRAGEEAVGGEGEGGEEVWEPEGLADPDDPRVDIVGICAELVTWSTALAKKAQLEAAVRLQWRLADICRANQMAATEMQLPNGKVSTPDAYERCLLLDLSVPGVARVAARMLAQRNNGSATAATSATTGADSAVDAPSSKSAPTSAEPACASPQKAGAEGPDGPHDDSMSSAGYLELIQELGRLWGAQDYSAAEVAARRIVAVQSAGHGAVSQEVVEARRQLASLLHSAGRQEEGVAEMRAALGVHQRMLHGKDPGMAQTLQSLAHMLSDREEAEQLYRQAVALVEKVHGPDHFEVGMALVSLGGFLMEDGERLAEGQQALNRGLAIQQKFQEQQQALAKAF
ncbi:hypothetical protein Agub_g2489 [Astrephomene gubernaculifera]|uniref:Uncharacterized protein n=1 Tax=Astrephomene gubernaculifera TaxID=47775 RepID=A0AAD3HIF2_9CHLO|nr:hypothetical protein Agub_g2489 [Astrephomene gubernaculifera]